MRKKLFAVIMSAMMMITFMPAMAFATNVDTPTTVAGWTFDGVTDRDDDGTFEKIYDGKEHAVVYNLVKPVPATMATADAWYEVGVAHYNVYSEKGIAVQKEVASVSLKDAGTYRVEAKVTTTEWDDEAKIWSSDWYWTNFLTVTISKRQVVVNGFNTLAMTKVYDGEGFALTDANFSISPVMVNGKAQANTGLVEGDTLYSGSFKTKADVGVYNITLGNVTTNANYAVTYGTQISEKCTMTITKADPNVRILTGALTIKRGNAKAAKATSKYGKVTLLKKSGNAKISLKNGKLKVAKNCKKGTYKIVLKAKVAEDTNWTSDVVTRTVKVTVK